MLAANVEGLLDDALVRASLALRHLEGIYDTLRYAEYEDVRPLEREAAWKSLYYQHAFSSPVSCILDWSIGTVVTGPQFDRLGEFYGVLAEAFMPRLQRVAGLAA